MDNPHRTDLGTAHADSCAAMVCRYHNGQMGLSVRGFCSTVLRNSTLAGNRQGGAQVLPATVEGTVVLLEGSKIIAPAQERATAANDVTQALHNEAGAQNMAATAPVVGW